MAPDRTLETQGRGDGVAEDSQNALFLAKMTLYGKIDQLGRLAKGDEGVASLQLSKLGAQTMSKHQAQRLLSSAVLVVDLMSMFVYTCVSILSMFVHVIMVFFPNN